MNAIEREAVRAIARKGTDMHRPLTDLIEAKYPGAITRELERQRQARFDRIFIGPVPAWAKRMVEKHGKSDVSKFTWRRSRIKQYSSGHCGLYWGAIVVTAGPDEEEQKGVVLHEIAHAVSGVSHDDQRFWTIFHRLLVAEGLYRSYITKRPWRTMSLKAAARRARAKR